MRTSLVPASPTDRSLPIKDDRMNSKTAPFRSVPAALDSAPIWVANPNINRPSSACDTINEVLPSQGETKKRFTIDVSEELHKRIKAQCAMRGAKMADVMREILEHAFPKQ